MTGEPDSGARTHFDRRAIPCEAVETKWQATDGASIRRIDWLIPHGLCRGSILFLPGRGDCYEKYLETLDYWHRHGWRVTASDWRGQAGSGRLGLDAVTGHIDDFATWVDDLAQLWALWRKNTPAPHVLAGHSMGGHLVLRALAERRVDPVAAILVAPMLGFLPAWIPNGAKHALARLMVKIGDSRRPAWKWSEKPGALPAGRHRLLTNDDQRYADEVWWREHRPELVMGPGSWGWLERACASIAGLNAPDLLEAVDVPVQMLATSADKLVAFPAI
ncbi:MAG: alpha/beta hydrolase, partial [Novosphingobium sp.]